MTMGLPSGASGIMRLVRDNQNGLVAPQELIRVERNSTSASGDDTVSASGLVRFNNAVQGDRLRIVTTPDPTRRQQGAVTFLGGQSGGYMTSFSGFSLTAAFDTPRTFDRVLRNIGAGEGDVTFNEGLLIIQQSGFYLFTVTSTLTVLGRGIDLRLSACGQTFSNRRLSNGGFSSQSDTVQVSGLVACNAGNNVTVQRSGSENIHSLRLFGFQYNPRGGNNVAWNLDQQQFIDNSRATNNFNNVPYVFVDNSNFLQGVQVPTGNSPAGSFQIQTSGIYFLHMHLISGWTSPLHVRVERLRGTNAPENLFSMRRGAVEPQGFVDSMARSVISELLSGDVIRVNLLEGVLYTSISTTDKGSRLLGFLVIPNVPTRNNAP